MKRVKSLLIFLLLFLAIAEIFSDISCRGPSEEILAEYRKLKIPRLRTDREGTIVIRTDGKRVWF